MEKAEYGSLLQRLLAKEEKPERAKRVRSSTQKRKRKIEPEQSVYGEITVRAIKGKEWIIVECGYVLEMHLLRSVFCAAYPPVHVSPHIDNVLVLRKVLERYPMKINTPKKWEEIQGRVDAELALAGRLSSLEHRSPDPDMFCGELMEFQKLGLDFFEKTRGVALLADEMGLGKTVQTLAYLSCHPEAMPAVVVAPLITLDNWSREVRRFLRTPGDGGEPAVPRIAKIRKGARKALPEADIYLINYELVGKRIKDLINAGPATVVFDEIQHLRNPSSKRFAACQLLAGTDGVDRRIGLSGTPIYNHGIEMHGISDVLKPGVLGERYEFVGKYCDRDTSTTSRDRRKPLSEVLGKSILLRRRKAEVMSDMPDKNRLVQNIDIDEEQYDMAVEAMYQKMESAKALADAASGAERDSLMSEFNQEARQMRIQERQVAGIAKAPHVVEYLNMLLSDHEEEKFVVFCHHKEVRRILFRGLRQADPVQVMGGQTDRARQAAIDSFQEDPDCRAIICGLRAGNLGINLTRAAYVIFAELDWSPAIHVQAEDRLHRIGQKRAVFSHYLVGRGTFDEFLVGTLSDKAEQIGSALGDRVEKIDNARALEALRARFGSKVARDAGRGGAEADRLSI